MRIGTVLPNIVAATVCAFAVGYNVGLMLIGVSGPVIIAGIVVPAVFAVANLYFFGAWCKRYRDHQGAS